MQLVLESLHGSNDIFPCMKTFYMNWLRLSRTILFKSTLQNLRAWKPWWNIKSSFRYPDVLLQSLCSIFRNKILPQNLCFNVTLNKMERVITFLYRYWCKSFTSWRCCIQEWNVDKVFKPKRFTVILIFSMFIYQIVGRWESRIMEIVTTNVEFSDDISPCSITGHYW